MKVVGLEELKRDLLKISQFVHDQVLPDAVMAAAEVIRTEIERRAPRRTGYLAEHIKIAKTKSRNISGAEIVGARVGPDMKDPYYALFVEYGYRAMGRAGRRARSATGATHSQSGVLGGTKVPARPFVRPAVDSAGEAALEAARRVVEDKLKSMGIS